MTTPPSLVPWIDAINRGCEQVVRNRVELYRLRGIRMFVGEISASNSGCTCDGNYFVYPHQSIPGTIGLFFQAVFINATLWRRILDAGTLCTLFIINSPMWYAHLLRCSCCYYCMFPSVWNMILKLSFSADHHMILRINLPITCRDHRAKRAVTGIVAFSHLEQAAHGNTNLKWSISRLL